MLCFIALLAQGQHLRWTRDGVIRRLGDPSPLPDASNCTTHFYRQHVDHYNFAGNATFLQRYLLYDRYWKAGGPIFFYAGNEADVTLYVNHTGLMWEVRRSHDLWVDCNPELTRSRPALAVRRGVWCAAPLCGAPVLGRVVPI